MMNISDRLPDMRVRMPDPLNDGRREEASGNHAFLRMLSAMRAEQPASEDQGGVGSSARIFNEDGLFERSIDVRSDRSVRQTLRSYASHETVASDLDHTTPPSGIPTDAAASETIAATPAVEGSAPGSPDRSGIASADKRQRMTESAIGSADFGLPGALSSACPTNARVAQECAPEEVFVSASTPPGVEEYRGATTATRLALHDLSDALSVVVRVAERDRDQRAKLRDAIVEMLARYGLGSIEVRMIGHQQKGS